MMTDFYSSAQKALFAAVHPRKDLSVAYLETNAVTEQELRDFYPEEYCRIPVYVSDAMPDGTARLCLHCRSLPEPEGLSPRERQLTMRRTEKEAVREYFRATS
jgi:hypothetical protein